MTFPILSLTTFLPLVGAMFIMFIRGQEEEVARNARFVALWTSLITFILSLFILANYNPSIGSDTILLKEEARWIPGISYRMGVDGISLWFILLSTFLTPICVLASWKSITTRVREYMIAFLVLETLMVGMFSAMDMVLFYVFFEAVLIPMYLIIGIWGGPRRVYAAFKFFLYTLLGSVLMLVAVVTLYHVAATTSIPELMAFAFNPETGQFGFSAQMQFWIFLAFLASFAVKVPMWPVHTWLPDAHVEAPTAGSVILAGILLKMGGYGFLRFSIPLAPVATEMLAPVIFGLSLVAIVYTSLVAWAQTDMKKLIAYSSVAHMGFVTLGIFTLNQVGVTGGVFQMLSHGIVSAALFLVVGVVYDRLHSREIADYGGVVHIMPKFAVFAMIFTLASIGLPGTSGFVGEFASLAGAWLRMNLLAVIAASGVVLGAVYMLSLYRRVFFGEVVHERVKSMPELDWREMVIFTSLAALVFWMGVFPSHVTDLMQPSVEHLVETYDAAIRAYQAQLGF